jgi:hypothetical protein
MFKKIALDFAPGMHGHFLEYVTNRYIYDVDEIKDLFMSSGAVDRIKTFEDYQKAKTVCCGHYSSFGLPMTESTEKIIFIRHTPALDIILLTNIYYRCHAVAARSYDYDVEKIMEYHRTLMPESQEDWQLKNNWYTKLTERHFDQTLAYNNPRNLPTLNFNFECFFEFPKFVSELQKVSQFLNMTLRYDSSLYDLWCEFMKRNQGYNLYTQANKILSFAYGNQKYKIPDDWKLHAYINYVLTKSFRIHDGVLHTDNKYPTDTCVLYSIIQHHLNTFDEKF